MLLVVRFLFHLFLQIFFVTYEPTKNYIKAHNSILSHRGCKKKSNTIVVLVFSLIEIEQLFFDVMYHCSCVFILSVTCGLVNQIPH